MYRDLHGHVKKCKCKTNTIILFYVARQNNVMNVIFTWGRGGFHNVFGDTTTKWPIEKKNHQNICVLGCITTSLIN
jgi:hypothetical protein